jgi:hypothetical protein
MGLHQLGGFSPEAARSAFGLDADLDLVSVLVLGFPGDPDDLPENLRERELNRSARKPLAEILHLGRFRS